MTKEKQIEAAARLEGVWSDEIKIMVTYYGGLSQWHGEFRKTRLDECADYFNDHNAVQRLVNGLDWKTLHKYVDNLIYMFEYQKDIGDVQLNNTYKATCKQKLEAVLKATNKWKINYE